MSVDPLRILDDAMLLRPRAEVRVDILPADAAFGHISAMVLAEHFGERGFVVGGDGVGERLRRRFGRRINGLRVRERRAEHERRDRERAQDELLR